MLTNRERLARQRAKPLLVELHRALSRLGSVLTVMNTGAHPDDEQNGLLALLRFDQGMRVVIACSTRGEGGQSTLGPERGAALGVVRTRELEEAARVIDADIAWLGFGPDDPVHDFGFSKNGADTLARWGEERLLEQLVRAYRRERPDIVIPTFLDVPGQHGHHRAMTEAAETAIGLAADPAAFPEHLDEGLLPWRVGKYFLPAWSGGGGTYDDEVPPPNASVVVTAPGPDPATGAAYGDIGEWSRAFHASQGMGHWSAEPKAAWPLHLKLGQGGEGIAGGLPSSLALLADELSPEAAGPLRAADAAIRRAVAAFPERSTIIAALAAAADQLDRADGALGRTGRELHGHRLARKRVEIDAALLLAAGVTASAWVEPATVAPGGETTLFVHIAGPEAAEAGVDLRLPSWITPGEPGFADGVTSIPLTVAADASLTSPFTPAFASLGPNGGVGLSVIASAGGREARAALDLDEPLEVVPAHSVSIEPAALVLALDRLPAEAEVAIRVDGPPAGVALKELAGMTATPIASGFQLAFDLLLRSGRYTLPLRVDGRPAQQRLDMAFPHIGRARLISPAELDILALDLALPEARVGYVGGGADRVGFWLRQMGVDVTELDSAALAGDLSPYASIVIGIFAFGLRPDLAAATEKLHRWVEGGGHLLTLYHRPSDGWDPDHTPPRRLVIGSPSLRWRVTDPNAAVAVLAPDHPLLLGPNRIGPDDWAGWDKERGLYFASHWDPAYVPLLALHDAGEPPLRGGLLSAEIGAGRHTHTSLVLHHQLGKLVPGAFRILANLLQTR